MITGNTWNRISAGRIGYTHRNRNGPEMYMISLIAFLPSLKNTTGHGEKLNQLDSELMFPAIFAFVPWKHHVLIMQKSKSVEEALFYVQKTVEGNLSRNTLDNIIRADLYHTSGNAVTNFTEKLPAIQGDLAQEIQNLWTEVLHRQRYLLMPQVLIILLQDSTHRAGPLTVPWKISTLMRALGVTGGSSLSAEWL